MQKIMEVSFLANKQNEYRLYRKIVKGNLWKRPEYRIFIIFEFCVAFITGLFLGFAYLYFKNVYCFLDHYEFDELQDFEIAIWLTMIGLIMHAVYTNRIRPYLSNRAWFRISFQADKEHRYTCALLEKGILLQFDEENYSITSYSQLNKVISMSEHLIIITNSFKMFIIPNHAFESVEQCQRFQDYLTNKVNESTHS